MVIALLLTMSFLNKTTIALIGIDWPTTKNLNIHTLLLQWPLLHYTQVNNTTTLPFLVLTCGMFCSTLALYVHKKLGLLTVLNSPDHYGITDMDVSRCEMTMTRQNQELLYCICTLFCGRSRFSERIEDGIEIKLNNFLTFWKSLFVLKYLYTVLLCN